jgi:hypothetical protein
VLRTLRMLRTFRVVKLLRDDSFLDWRALTEDPLRLNCRRATRQLAALLNRDVHEGCHSDSQESKVEHNEDCVPGHRATYGDVGDAAVQ